VFYRATRLAHCRGARLRAPDHIFFEISPTGGFPQLVDPPTDQMDYLQKPAPLTTYGQCRCDEIRCSPTTCRSTAGRATRRCGSKRAGCLGRLYLLKVEGGLISRRRRRSKDRASSRPRAVDLLHGERGRTGSASTCGIMPQVQVDSFQQTYVVIDSFEAVRATSTDFHDLTMRRCAGLPGNSWPADILPSDVVLSGATGGGLGRGRAIIRMGQGGASDEQEVIAFPRVEGIPRARLTPTCRPATTSARAARRGSSAPHPPLSSQSATWLQFVRDRCGRGPPTSPSQRGASRRGDATEILHTHHIRRGCARTAAHATISPATGDR